VNKNFFFVVIIVVVVVVVAVVVIAGRNRNDLVDDLALDVRKQQSRETGKSQEGKTHGEPRPFRLSGDPEGSFDVVARGQAGFGPYPAVSSQDVFPDNGRIAAGTAGEANVKVAERASVAIATGKGMGGLSIVAARRCVGCPIGGSGSCRCSCSTRGSSSWSGGYLANSCNRSSVLFVVVAVVVVLDCRADPLATHITPVHCHGPVVGFEIERVAVYFRRQEEQPLVVSGELEDQDPYQVGFRVDP